VQLWTLPCAGTRGPGTRRPAGQNHPDHKTRQRRWAKRLLKDQVESLIKETRRTCAGQPQTQAVERNWVILSVISTHAVWLLSRAGYFIARASWRRLQDGHWRTLQTIRHVLVPTRRRKFLAVCCIHSIGAWISSGNTGSINMSNVMTHSLCPPDEEFCPPPLVDFVK